MPQISATIRQPLVDEIRELSHEQDRSFSDTVEYLLDKAMENERKKVKGGNSQRLTLQHQLPSKKG